MRNGYGFTEADFNLGFIDTELLSPDQRGEGGEDDPADQRDDAWTRHGVARAAAFGDEDHMAALMGPTRFDAMMHRAYLERMDRRLELTFRCRGSSRTRVYRDPAYRVGPPLACR